jgi:hypothetical protein
MDTSIDINFKVTPAQKAKIDSRAFENGFDDISAYLKVAALRTQEFKLTTAEVSTDNATIELGFKATQAQIEKIEENMQNSKCEDLTTYLLYVALHALVTAVIEIRSTGGLDEMLKRISDSRKPKNLKRLF